MSYLYRDASNNKRSGEIIVEGRLRFEDLLPFLLQVSENEFVPEDVGLEHPGAGFPGFPGAEDINLCGLLEDDFEDTDEPATNGTATDLIEKFRAAHAAGWPNQFNYL